MQPVKASGVVGSSKRFISISMWEILKAKVINKITGETCG